MHEHGRWTMDMRYVPWSTTFFFLVVQLGFYLFFIILVGKWYVWIQGIFSKVSKDKWYFRWFYMALQRINLVKYHLIGWERFFFSIDCWWMFLTLEVGETCMASLDFMFVFFVVIRVTQFLLYDGFWSATVTLWYRVNGERMMSKMKFQEQLRQQFEKLKIFWKS